jgi:arylsulfatase A-like enzyme
LVEAVDIAPTFLDVYGGNPVPHIMDGRSLRPLLFGQTPTDWRNIAVCECDYAFQDARIELKQPPIDSWMRMAFDGRWKYVLCEGHRSMLFDLQSDPHELTDLGTSADPEHVRQRARLHEALFEWARRPRQRVTVSDEMIENTEIQARIAENGILIGYADEDDLRAQRQTFKPRYASHNPLVKEALDRLTGQHVTTEKV